MKKLLLVPVVVLLAASLFGGCVDLSIGDKNKSEAKRPTIEQQLNDLEKARKSGAITEEQYDTQRTKLLESQ